MTDIPETAIVTPVPTSLLFIDGTNLDHRAREAFSRDDIDFPKLFAELATGTNLLHTHYFTAPYRTDNTGKYAKQMSDFNILKKLPNVTLKLGRHQPRIVECKNCNHTYTTYVEKGTDVAVASALVHAACHKKAGRLILFTGDNDFWPAVRMARDEGAHVEVAFVIKPFEELRDQLNLVSMLRYNATRYIKLDEQFMAKCWRNPVASTAAPAA